MLTHLPRHTVDDPAAATKLTAACGDSWPEASRPCNGRAVPDDLQQQQKSWRSRMSNRSTWLRDWSCDADGYCSGGHGAGPPLIRMSDRLPWGRAPCGRHTRLLIMMTKLQALVWISNKAPECLYGVLKRSWEGLVTGNVGPPAGNRPPTTPRYFHGATTTPGSPQGSSRFPCRNQDFGCHFLALRSANLNCYSHCRECEFVRSFPARAFVRRCFAGGPPFPILRRLSLA